MKKLFILFLTSVFAASCTLPGMDKGGNSDTPKDTGPNGQAEVSVKAGDFKSLYGAYMTAQWNEAKAILNIDEMFAPKKASGDMKLVVKAGQFGSLDAAMKISALANGLKSKVVFSDVSVNLQSAMIDSINAKVQELAIIQSPLQTFASFKGIELPESMASMMDNFKKYEGKWVELPNGQQDEEVAKVMKQLFSLTEKEIKEMLTQYPIFKAKGEAKIDGTKNTFEVELDAENMIALAKKLTKRLDVDAEMTKEDEENFKKDIEEANKISNFTLTFDTKNHLFLDGKAEIDDKVSGKGTITLKTDKNMMTIDMDAPDEVKAGFNMKKENDTHKVDAFAKQGENEVFKSHVEFAIKDKKLSHFMMDLDVPEEKLNITAKYKNENNAFDGAMKVTLMDETQAQVTFDGTSKNETAQTFNLVADIKEAGKLEIHTKDPKDDIMKGKLTLTPPESAGMDGDVTGNIGLGLGKEIFALSLDSININIDQMKDSPQAQMVKDFMFEFVTHGKEEKTNEKVEFPTDFVPADEFQKALKSPMPYEDDATDTSIDMDETSVSVDTSDSDVMVKPGTVEVDSPKGSVKIDANSVSVEQ
ncbi:hypothetical protein CSB09_00700 [Candidatus Gracilibacteria bacterium]|nr:MAG: hypothetical protein CSB09_00700 [Candidatus Gracilibacteria bacterium]